MLILLSISIYIYVCVCVCVCIFIKQDRKNVLILAVLPCGLKTKFKISKLECFGQKWSYRDSGRGN